MFKSNVSENFIYTEDRWDHKKTAISVDCADEYSVWQISEFKKNPVSAVWALASNLWLQRCQTENPILGRISQLCAYTDIGNTDTETGDSDTGDTDNSLPI